jgi:hypothetical protein
MPLDEDKINLLQDSLDGGRDRDRDWWYLEGIRDFLTTNPMFTSFNDPEDHEIRVAYELGWYDAQYDDNSS